MKHTQTEKLPTDKAFLHFDALRISDGEIQVDYELVLPLDEVDCRGTWDHKGRKSRPKSGRIVWLDCQNNKRIPLGRTKVGTSSKTYPFSNYSNGEEALGLPFRDGAHCTWDGKKFNGLPLFYSFGGKHWELTQLEPRG
jgi:hypothetical protein